MTPQEYFFLLKKEIDPFRFRSVSFGNYTLESIIAKTVGDAIIEQNKGKDQIELQHAKEGCKEFYDYCQAEYAARDNKAKEDFFCSYEDKV